MSLCRKLPAQAYPHLEVSLYQREIRPLIGLLSKRIRERVFALLQKAYTDVPLATISQALGLSLDNARKLVTTAGWTIDDTTGIATRPPTTIYNKGMSTGGTGGLVGLDGLQRISTVADYVVNLERV